MQVNFDGESSAKDLFIIDLKMCSSAHPALSHTYIFIRGECQYACF